MTPTNQTAAPDPTFGERMAACVADIDADQQRAGDEQLVRYHQEKREAVEQFVTDLRVEVLRRILKRADSVPFVAKALYYDDAPEGQRFRDARERLGDAFTAFARRAHAIQQRAERMADESETGAAEDLRHWDEIRLQRAGTRAAAVDLLAEAFIVAFTCDQYGCAKYLWRERPESDGSARG